VGEGEGEGSNVGMEKGKGVAEGEGVRDGRGVASFTVKRARVSTATGVEKLGVEESRVAPAGSSVGRTKSVATVGGGEWSKAAAIAARAGGSTKNGRPTIHPSATHSTSNTPKAGISIRRTPQRGRMCLDER
jgi:hypothetical protein